MLGCDICSAQAQMSWTVNGFHRLKSSRDLLFVRCGWKVSQLSSVSGRSFCPKSAYLRFFLRHHDMSDAWMYF
jgi:hypothetical protein